MDNCNCAKAAAGSKIYILENVDNGKTRVFEHLEDARKTLIECYIQNFYNWYIDSDDGTDCILSCIKEDLNNLFKDNPCIEEVAYISEGIIE